MRMVLLLAASAALVGALAYSLGSHEAAQPRAEPGFEVFHLNSRIEGNEFREVFIVDRLVGGLDVPIQDVSIRLDGEVLAVDWSDRNGRLDRNDTFSFVQEAFDVQQVLTGHLGEATVMTCRFGGGAGHANIHPDVYRAQGGRVRCLDELDDG